MNYGNNIIIKVQHFAKTLLTPLAKGLKEHI